ncbi:MAG: glycosyltransferase [Bacteroidota bacterium]
MSSPPHICHLTVLNPLKHSRVYHRLARSQKELGYRVSILAQGESAVSEGVELVGITPFSRLSLRRFLFPLTILPTAKNQRAALYFLHSPELLFTGLLLKWWTGAKIWYDVHEDYRVNLQGATHYPSWLKRPLAWLVRKWERFARRWLDGVSYAEDCYDNILEIPTEKKVILRNKFSHPVQAEASPRLTPPRPYLLYTGTIAPDWGLWEALAVWKQINAIRPVHMVIAGHTHHAELIEELNKRVQQTGLADRFQLIGGIEYVPYEQILALIQQCWVGVGLYRPLPHIRGKIPTKFYEFMAHDRPLLFSDHPEWQAFDQQQQLGFPHQAEMDWSRLWEKVDQWEGQHVPADYSWESEVPSMNILIERLIGSAATPLDIS